MSDEIVKGGSFLLAATGSTPIFIQEEFGEDSLMMARTGRDFMVNEVLPYAKEIQEYTKKVDINIKLLKKAGELGLLGVEVAEEYGGMGQDMKTTMLVAEYMAVNGSFATSVMCHTGIGSLPIAYFGTPDQKQRYLTKLATGEFLGAYALTEANSGSDALNAKTRAVLSEDGKYYTLNGTKLWITNAGFADTFIVYAQVIDGDQKKFTAFIVEKAMPGVSTGAEEHKMGIQGSSTRELILEDVKVPVENVLGEIGKGHKCALNILNIGRFKLGVASLGAAKNLCGITLKYALERKQFGTQIGNFGMIRRKLADMGTGIYATEAMSYRTAGLIDEAIHRFPRTDAEFDKKAMASVEEYALECSILKVYGSEMLSKVADDAVQTHGGVGFSEEYEACVAYRDCRINRIFEGTNEVNRLLIPATLMRKAMKGEIDLFGAIGTIVGEIKNDSVCKTPAAGPLGREKAAVDIIKKLTVYGAGTPVQKFMTEMQDQRKVTTVFEQIFERMADMVMDAYAADSALARTMKLIELWGEEKASVAIKLCQVVVYEALQRTIANARQVCADTAQGNETEFQKNLKGVQRLSWEYPLDTNTLKYELAGHFLAREAYSLE